MVGDRKDEASGLFTTAVNVIAAPGEALRTIREESKILAPLCALLIANAAVFLAYYSEVDVVWLLETSMQSSADELSQEQREAAVRAMGNVSPMVMGSASAVSAAVAFTFAFFLYAAYLAGVSLLTNDGFGIRSWFSMICWCTLPVVFGYGASLANIVFGDATFLRWDQLNPLSFGSLFNVDSDGSGTFRQSVLGLDVTMIWAMVLYVYGYRTWTGRGVLESALIVLAPTVLVMGAIAWFASG